MSAAFRCLVGVLLVAAVLAATGCGETVIDPVKTEGAIQADLEKSLHEKITSVECPSGQAVDPGKTFTCAIEFADGKQAEETLKILNKEADMKPVGLKPKP